MSINHGFDQSVAVVQPRVEEVAAAPDALVVTTELVTLESVASPAAAETNVSHQAGEIAAVVWLCSDRSSVVTGVALPVDGGYTAH